MKSFGENYLKNFRYQCFSMGFLKFEVLDKDARPKERSIRGKHSPFVNRELSKVIMARTCDKKTLKKFQKEKMVRTKSPARDNKTILCDF